MTHYRKIRIILLEINFERSKTAMGNTIGTEVL